MRLRVRETCCFFLSCLVDLGWVGGFSGGEEEGEEGEERRGGENTPFAQS